MACEAIQQKLAALQETQKETLQDLQQHGLSPAERAQLLQQLKGIGQSINSTKIQLEQCLKAAVPPFLPPVTTPVAQRVLDIQYQNPIFQAAPGDWGQVVANGPGSKPTDQNTFPQNVTMEWVQPLAPNDEYDKFSVVGATGWAVNPRVNTIDFPFDHPFGFDWEFSMALDPAKPGQAPPFDFLLSPGNKATPAHSDQVEDEQQAAALGLSTAKGLLGVEWDAGLVPAAFLQQVHSGHRVATFGRWIVDTGHTNYRAEIHPPLLMAAASTTADATRVMFTSRPYLGGQTYTLDTSKAYDDASGDDGTFYSHLLNEVVKVATARSTLVEVHPKIKAYPFHGAFLLHIVVRTPTPPSVTTALHHLAVSFQFTVRSGCAVEVTTSAADTVDVYIAMSDGGYTPPPLPTRNDKRYSKDELDKLSSGAGGDYLKAEVLAALAATLLGGAIDAAVVTAFLERGIETDAYSPVSGAINILDATHAVQGAAANSIPAGQGIVQNDGQPFPVCGWLEAKWVQNVAAAG